MPAIQDFQLNVTCDFGNNFRRVNNYPVFRRGTELSAVCAQLAELIKASGLGPQELTSVDIARTWDARDRCYSFGIDMRDDTSKLEAMVATNSLFTRSMAVLCHDIFPDIVKIEVDPALIAAYLSMFKVYKDEQGNTCVVNGLADVHPRLVNEQDSVTVDSIISESTGRFRRMHSSRAVRHLLRLVATHRTAGLKELIGSGFTHNQLVRVEYIGS